MILLITSANTLADGESGSSVTQAFPKRFPTRGSIGKVPNNGTFTKSASAAPPPALNIFVHSVQCGQTNLEETKHFSKLHFNYYRYCIGVLFLN